MKRLRQRLRAEEGFGLVELMISLVVLNVGILAIVAAFQLGHARAPARHRNLDRIGARRQADGALPRDHVRRDLAQHDGGRRDVHRRRRLSRDAGDGDLHVAGRRLVRSDANRHCRPSPDGRPYRIDTFIITQTPAEWPARSSA